jgi:hypothetical protein
MLTPDDIETLNNWKAIGDRWRTTGERILEVVNWCISHRNMEGMNNMDYAFDPTGITPGFSGGGGQLPVGKHPVTITKSEGKPTRDNTGGFIEFTLTAFDGPAKGQSGALRLNLHNTSEDAVRIAREQLAALCVVTQTGPFQKTDELHNKPFVVEVAPQKTNPKYTEVIAVFDMQGNAPGEGAPQGQQQQQGGGFQQGGGAAGTGTIPPAGGGFQQGGGDQQQQQGGGFGGNGGFGGGGQQQQQQGGGTGWQQGGGTGAGASTGGAAPGWGQR